MDSLRYALCPAQACRRQFFLCSRCDRGQRYCSPACSAAARRTERRETAARYQRGHRGRRLHAARQARYRERRAQKVTHPGRGAGMVSGTLRALVVAALAAAPTKDSPRVEALPIRPRCRVCGLVLDFVRPGTLARRRPPWRWW